MNMTRVRIAITNPKYYTQAAVANMDGKLGRVVERRDGDKWDVERALVKFDEPAARLYDNGREVGEFWFPVRDLAAWPWGAGEGVTG